MGWALLLAEHEKIQENGRDTVSEPIFRKYRTGDEWGLTLLAKAVWGSDYSEEYWRWKYVDNPARDNHSYVAECRGEIVGFSGCIPWKIGVSGKEAIGAQMTDMMVHPEWRRKDIYFPLNRCVLEEIKRYADLQYGFTNPSSFRIYKKRFKYDGFSPVKMQKVVNTRLLVWQGIRKLKPADVKRVISVVPRTIAYMAGTSSGRFGHAGKKVEIKRLQHFDDRFDEFWIRVRQDLKIATIRDRRYLDWRYLKNPERRYTILSAEQGGVLAGFAVLRSEETEGMMRGMVVDFLVAPAYEDSAVSLLEESLKFFRDENAALVNLWISSEHNDIFKLLAAKGFSAKQVQEVIVLLKSFTPNIESAFLRDPANWYLTMGDCEVF
ncbi:MAG: GNAT family N-acetyltransferase [Nitrospirota bacterium]